MKSSLIVLFCLALIGCQVAAADTANSPTQSVSPQAQAIRDRVNAAYSAVQGWSATTVSTVLVMEKGAIIARGNQLTERYLRSGGPISYYAMTRRSSDESSWFARSQDLAVEHGAYGKPAEIEGWLGAANDVSQPQTWSAFRGAVASADYVRWAGRESVDGQSCEIVETIALGRKDPAEPEVVRGVLTSRFYVDAAGFIRRITRASDGPAGAPVFASEELITYDAPAKLTAEDFTRARFERDVAPFLKGQPMPELKEQLYAAGGTLPDITFTAWADGKPFRLSDLKGKVVVVETWASWCHFCKEAFPTYERIRKALADQDVAFVAVSFDAKLADYEKWMKRHGGDYGFKFGRVEAEDPMKALKEFRGSLPAFYVLGRDGKIVSSYIGWGWDKGAEDPRLLAALRAAGVKI